ncbi:MAG TPA: UPF0182 family protein [Blastocatellia bacterium]|nr:UPF0182 family protein [Blastocatellia bacterium]
MRTVTEFPDEDFGREEPPGRHRNYPPQTRWRLLLLIALVFIAIVVWPAWAGFYTTWLWFQQLGYQLIFSTTLLTKIMLAVVTGVVATVLVWANLKLALHLSPAEQPVNRRFGFKIEGQSISLPDLGEIVGRLVLPVSLGAGVFLGMIGWASWETWLLFRHQMPFGDVDPVFGRDIGFYFFTLPMIETLAQWLLILMVIGLAGAAAIHLPRAAVGFGRFGRSLMLGNKPRAQLLILVAGLFLVIGLEIYLEIPNLLYSTSGPVAGAGYTDLNAEKPLLWIKAGAAVLVSLAALASLFGRQNWLLWAGVAVFALAFIAGIAYPPMVQRFSVAPNELAKETPYIKYNIAATRKAYGLEQITERELLGDTTLTAQNIQQNRPTINNIRLWDQQPLLDTYTQIQEIRTYYKFATVDNDRYRINGQLQQVMLSAREFSTNNLPNRNWINERLTFTHGFGLTVGPVNEVTPEGLPVLYVRDIPPTATIPQLNVTRPEIYFGELLTDRVYVKTRAKEFNYPSGEDNIFTTYEGEGGIPIGSRWRQLLFATRFGDMKLMLSNDLTPDSRALFYRNVRERVEQVAPFLRFDRDPYLVISEGRLFWILDAYTVSNRYPYSQPYRGLNYIRNSVKAVVDAYHGHVTLYIAADQDPLIQTYARIFPGILKPLSEMPSGLREHLRYPEDIFSLQATVYSTYHMENPQVFYNKEDQWTLASTGVGVGEGEREGPANLMEPYYTIMKIPGEEREEFILMLPFTPNLKDNLSAWMVARADGEHYGKLAAYRFPKQKLVFGPKQVMARINQDPKISEQLSLWNRSGSQVILGTLMVIPIEESLLYVQPLYLRAATGKIPELRRVIVVAENRIAMEPNLPAALKQLFGDGSIAPSQETLAQQPAPANDTSALPAASGQTSEALSGLALEAKQHYDQAQRAQREGDWARYGEEVKRLGAVLEKMSKQK